MASTLLRSPAESASWTWNLDGVEPPGLESAPAVAARMSPVLREHGLLEPPFALEWDWFVYGSGGIGVTTRLSLRGPLDDAELPAQVLAARPVGFPDAQVGSILVMGSGTWIDAAGEKHRAHRLA